MSKWSELPCDLLTMIHEDLAAIRDKIRFTCVCTHWRSSSPAGLPDLRQPPPPWLLLPYETRTSYGVYHPSEKKRYNLEPKPKIVLKGSGYGWVVVEQDDLDGLINLVNPISKDQVSLPPRYTFLGLCKYTPQRAKSGRPRCYANIVKIALSCSPNSDGFRAAAIYQGGTGLAYCRAGDKSWTGLIESDDSRSGCVYKDVAFTEGRLYAMTQDGDVMVCDNVVSCPKLRMLVVNPVYADFSYCSVRLITRDQCIEGFDENVRFTERDSTVFRIDNGSSSLIPVGNLHQRFHDETLFTGLGAQVGISSQYLKGNNGNQIYFINDQLKGVNIT